MKLVGHKRTVVLLLNFSAKNPPPRQALNLGRNLLGMQEHIYTAQTRKIFSQSFFIFVFIAMHVMANFLLIPSLIKHNQLWGIPFFNLLMCMISIPSLVIFSKYYKQSVGKRFIVTYETLKFEDTKTGARTELINSEIEKITSVSTSWYTWSPWTFYEYFSITDKNQQTITITSFVLELSDFWLDTLTRRVKNPGVEFIKKEYPTF